LIAVIRNYRNVTFLDYYIIWHIVCSTSYILFEGSTGKNFGKFPHIITPSATTDGKLFGAGNNDSAPKGMRRFTRLGMDTRGVPVSRRLNSQHSETNISPIKIAGQNTL